MQTCADVMHALIVEDEAKAATFLFNGLSENGWAVDVAGDGSVALKFLREKTYDIVLLDVLLPGCDGWSVIHQMRASGVVTPVIFLTARDSLGERIRGLDLGADDYLVKPFAFSELMARIRSILRRGRDPNPTILRISDLEVDLIGHKVVRQNQPIELTPKEFALLALLARTPTEIVGRRLIAKEIWNMEVGSDSNVVDVAVRRLRRKVDHPFDKHLIHSVYGVGYVLGER
jgi:two-component system copper resistance phosphate regulon response regulator CusR